MSSSKRSRGQARRAARARQQQEKLTSASNQKQQQQQQKQQQSPSEKYINSKSCSHGFDSVGDDYICLEFVYAYLLAYGDVDENSDNGWQEALDLTSGKYVDMMKDANKMQWIASHFVTIAANLVIDGNLDGARGIASFASFFEQYIAVELTRRQATMNVAKLEELAMTDEHTLMSFLKKRIPCSCLDVKYKQVKHVTKMGICSNPQCSLPDRKCERSAMLSCTRCCRVNYCSGECQKVHWQKHKQYCGECVERTANFNSKQDS